MYAVLYDQNMSSYRGLYKIESWNRVQRAYDFDTMSIVCQQLPSEASPFFVVVNNEKGHELFSGLAGTPDIDDKTQKTTLVLKDFMTLMNSEIIIPWATITTNYPNASVKTIFDVILGLWTTQNGEIGFDGISWNTDSLSNITADTSVIPTETESALVYDIISQYMSYYDLFCTPVLDVHSKSLTYNFSKVGIRTKNIRLSDYGIDRIVKDFGEYNKVSVYNTSYVLQDSYVLCEDNTIVKEPTNKPLVYPIKNRNYIASSDEDIASARYDAIMGLAENRYQENFDIDASNDSVLRGISFDTAVNIYTDLGLYKKMPVGEIETDSNGKYRLTIGYRTQLLTQLF